MQLAKELECEKKQIVVGYRDAQTFLKEEFEANGEVYIATEDGSVGTKGNVMDAIREACVWKQRLFMLVDRHRCFVRLKHMQQKIRLNVIFP